MRDIVDDQLIAIESCLYQAAVRREDLLRSFYRIGKRAVERATPFAFVISANQTDPGAATKLLQTLSFGQVEIDRATEAFMAMGKRYPSGSYIIRMQQPYSSFAKTLLERQNYPDLRLYAGGPPKRPYDVTAHTLPLLMGVSVDIVNQAFSVIAASAKTFDFPALSKGAILAATDTESWRALNRALESGRSGPGDQLVSQEPGNFV
jgi:hypothetical protein